MNNIQEFCPTDSKDWRKWLAKNHEIKDAVWVIFYKKKAKKTNLNWSEAVDEALCYGWIDSVKKTLDEDRFKQYFSKRKANSTWSKINKEKVDYLIKKKLMRTAGLKCIEVAKENGSWSLLDDVEAIVLPEDLRIELEKRSEALAFYESLSNSRKKILLAWVVMAKRAETREKRIKEIAENAGKGLMPKQFR